MCVVCSDLVFVVLIRLWREEVDWCEFQEIIWVCFCCVFLVSFGMLV